MVLTRRGSCVSVAAEAALPTRFGDFRVVAFRVEGAEPDEALAIVSGPVDGRNQVLVRVHSECLTGDALGSVRCDCRDQLEAALERIGESGGIVLYLRQEGRGIGLVDKIRAYALQDGGLDTVDANLALGRPDDARDYRPAAEMLEALGVRSIRLMTNNPDKVAQLERHGVTVAERVPHVMPLRPQNETYLRTKSDRHGHLLGLAEVAAK